ncbi:flagellar motor protein MotB [Paraburkholderia bryophila]|uniref:Flagellar motor protein MotB n=1 Tax=Paraburkholderia bryophila TaxID=420952 RepID=A0A7Z0AYK4_9BURK|nr:flagellar motor protein MotB [Paraburkholderia bryophila]
MMSERPSRASQQVETPAPVIVRRLRKGGDHAAHHGGAWKIAYADFVTAMMAFFLLMWLLGSTSKYDKQGIEDYFNTPLSSLLGGSQGTAAARPSVVQGGGRDISDTRPGDGKKSQTQPTPPTTAAPTVAPADAARLEQLKAKLTTLIEQSPALKAFKDQIRISITNEGLRIEIVDSQNRPMFASGSSKLQPYAVTILTQIGAALNDVDNRISIAGHTDAVPYTAGPGRLFELGVVVGARQRRAPRAGGGRHARRKAVAGARAGRRLTAEQQGRRRADQPAHQYPRAEQGGGTGLFPRWRPHRDRRSHTGKLGHSSGGGTSAAGDRNAWHAVNFSGAVGPAQPEGMRSIAHTAQPRWRV